MFQFRDVVLSDETDDVHDKRVLRRQELDGNELTSLNPLRLVDIASATASNTVRQFVSLAMRADYRGTVREHSLNQASHGRSMLAASSA